MDFKGVRLHYITAYDISLATTTHFVFEKFVKVGCTKFNVYTLMVCRYVFEGILQVACHYIVIKFDADVRGMIICFTSPIAALYSKRILLPV